MPSKLGSPGKQKKHKPSKSNPKKLFLPHEEDFDPFDPGAGLSFLVESLVEILRQGAEQNTLTRRFFNRMQNNVKKAEKTVEYCDAAEQLYKVFHERDLIGNLDVHASFKVRHALSESLRYRLKAEQLPERFDAIRQRQYHPYANCPPSVTPNFRHLMSFKGASVFLAAMAIEYSSGIRCQHAQPGRQMMNWLDELVFNALKQDSKDYRITWRPAYELLLRQLEDDRSKWQSVLSAQKRREQCRNDHMWNTMYNMRASYQSLKARLRFHVAEWLPLRILEGSNVPMEVQMMVQGYMRNEKLVERFETYRKITCYSCSTHDGDDWYCECWESGCGEKIPPHLGCHNCDRNVWER